MHEHLDEMGIIHMNGRVYDPLIGRFMSADPFIQSPMDLQSYNRYAYVGNNPLIRNDPSGYCWICHIVNVAGNNITTIAYIIFAPHLNPAGVAIFAAVSSWASGGNFEQGLRAGLISYVAAEANKYIGGQFKDKLDNVAAHIVLGCATFVAQGGQCGSGAAAAGIGAALSNYGPTFGSKEAGLIEGHQGQVFQYNLPS